MGGNVRLVWVMRSSADEGSIRAIPLQDLCSPWDLPRDMVLLRERDRASHRMSEIPPMKRANLH